MPHMLRPVLLPSVSVYRIYFVISSLPYQPPDVLLFKLCPDWPYHKLLICFVTFMLRLIYILIESGYYSGHLSWEHP